jgi:hypothetical protein
MVKSLGIEARPLLDDPLPGPCAMKAAVAESHGVTMSRIRSVAPST